MPKIRRSEQDLLKLMEWRQPAKGAGLKRQRLRQDGGCLSLTMRFG